MAVVFQRNVFQHNVFQGPDASGVVFQCNVFQNSVFQGPCSVTTTPAVGRVHRDRRYKLEDLERTLREQRPFTRQKYEEDLLAAEIAAAEKADQVKNTEQREALLAAADAVSELPVSVVPVDDLREITAALSAAASSIGATEAIHEANIALALAQHLQFEYEEEETAIMLLLS